ncbi:MAG TPA: dihydropteroate synthase, partial [Candidatus Limnocylindrales bacterium]
MDATPSVELPADADSGVVRRPPAPMRVGGRELVWGERTYVMGVINVTPDSFSGDGLLQSAADGANGADAVAAAVEQARRMVAEGADLLDVGGQSTRPGHREIEIEAELARVEPIVAAICAALPGTPISIDTTRADVAARAIAAGADMVNDVWGVAADERMLRLIAERGVPLVLMHNRAEARYRNVVAEVLADLSRALEQALAAGVAWEQTIV